MATDCNADRSCQYSFGTVYFAMFHKHVTNAHKITFDVNVRGSEEEREDDWLIETVEKDIVVEESETGLNDEIFGCILKMKEKERLKLVIFLVNYKAVTEIFSR